MLQSGKLIYTRYKSLLVYFLSLALHFEDPKEGLLFVYARITVKASPASRWTAPSFPKQQNVGCSVAAVLAWINSSAFDNESQLIFF